MKDVRQIYRGKTAPYRHLLVVGALTASMTVASATVAGERDVVVGTLGWAFEQFAKDLAVLRATAVERMTGKTGLLFFACSRGRHRMRLSLPPRGSGAWGLPSKATLMFRFVVPKADPRTLITRYAEAEFRPGLSISFEEGRFSDNVIDYILDGLSNKSMALDITVFIGTSGDSFVRGESIRMQFDMLQDMRLASSALLAACSRTE